MLSHPLRLSCAGLAGTLLANAAWAANVSDWAERSSLDMRPGITQLSHEVQSIHSTTLWVVSLIGLLVVVLMFWSMWRHRKSVHPVPSKTEGNIFLEITWTVIPVIILISLAWPATGLIVDLYDTTDAELTVKVTGSRWKWNYEYVAYESNNAVGLSFFSNLATPPEQYNNPVLPGGLFPYGTAKQRVGNGDIKKDHNYLLAADKPLVLPSETKIRFLITSADVIHSFFVPDFGWKKDAIPGYINTTWTKVPASEEGTYFGQCAELCGKAHAFMPIEIKVVSRKEFDGWLKQRLAAAAAGPDLTPFAGIDAAMTLGKKVFDSTCAVCHGMHGEGGIGVKMAGNNFFIDKSHLAEHIHVVTHGKNAMPSFSAQLTPREIAAVITYERNAFGNDSGQLVQPGDVAEAEKH